MIDVHAKIHDLKKTIVRDYKSTKPQPFDPIPPVAKSISDNSWLICFDEFQVSTITDLSQNAEIDSYLSYQIIFGMIYSDIKLTYGIL